MDPTPRQPRRSASTRLLQHPAGFALLVFVATSAGTALALLALGPRSAAPTEPPPSVLADQAPRSTWPSGPLSGQELERVDVVRRAWLSVVHIHSSLDTSREGYAELPANPDPTQVLPGTGSGVVWSKRGHIVTNAHLIDYQNTVRVRLATGEEFDAYYVAHSPAEDLAVLVIDAPPELLHPIALGRSADLEVGQSALSLGNPFGLDLSLSVGVVSGLGRSVKSRDGNVLEGMIQTDAAINPGSSGGPLLGSSGHLVGLNTAIHGRTHTSGGIGFALPVDRLNEVVPALIRSGIEPVFDLGVVLAPDDRSRQMLAPLGLQGVVLLGVDAGGPAAQAGLLPTRLSGGLLRLVDVVVGVEGQPVADRDALAQELHRRRGSPALVLNVVRADAEFPFQPSQEKDGELVLQGEPGAQQERSVRLVRDSSN